MQVTPVHDFDDCESDGGPELYQNFLDSLPASTRAIFLAPRKPTPPCENDVRNERIDQLLTLLESTADTRIASTKHRTSRDEANVLVSDYLKRNAKANPESVTIRMVEEETGVPKSTVGTTLAWRAFVVRRHGTTSRKDRHKSLTPAVLDTIAVVIPFDSDAEETPRGNRQAELAALTAEQEKEKRCDMRRVKSRRRID